MLTSKWKVINFHKFLNLSLNYSFVKRQKLRKRCKLSNPKDCSLLMKLSQAELAQSARIPKWFLRWWFKSSTSLNLSVDWNSLVISKIPVLQYVLVLCSFILICYMYVLLIFFLCLMVAPFLFYTFDAGVKQRYWVQEAMCSLYCF